MWLDKFPPFLIHLMGASLPSTVIYSEKSVQILFAEYFSSKIFSLVYLHFHLQFCSWQPWRVNAKYACQDWTSMWVCAWFHGVLHWDFWNLNCQFPLCNNSKTCIMWYLLGGKCNFGQTLKTQTRMNGSYKRYNILVEKGENYCELISAWWWGKPLFGDF